MRSATAWVTGMAEIGDTKLAYHEEGRGEPVVFVHGTLSDLRTWQAQVPFFAHTHRALAYSRRYAAPNPDVEPGADDPMPVHVDDLARFLRALDAAPAHVVGSSWGGFVSLLLAIRHPELVRSLVLAEPPVVPLFMGLPPTPGKLLRLLVTRPRAAMALMRFVGGTVGPAQRALEQGRDEEAMRRFGDGVVGPGFFDGSPPEVQARIRENFGAFREQILGEGFPPIADDEVRSVRVPTLLVTGERSPAFLLRVSDRLEELLPNVSRVEIPGASHVMFESHPEAFNAAVAAFLARVPDAGPGTAIGAEGGAAQ
jgi:pimeloyl-ACP methyl ester carboxylesterase